MVCCYSSDRNLLLTDGASAGSSRATPGGNVWITQLSLAVPSLSPRPAPPQGFLGPPPCNCLCPHCLSQSLHLGDPKTLPVFNSTFFQCLVAACLCQLPSTAARLAAKPCSPF